MKGKKCPVCGEEIQEGFEVCPNCGTSLKEPESNKCPVCGEEIQEGFTVCPNCGTLLSEESQNIIGEPQDKTSPDSVEKDVLSDFGEASIEDAAADLTAIDLVEEVERKKNEKTAEYNKIIRCANIFCIRSMFDEAKKIYDSLIDEDPENIDGFIGLIRIASKNYTVYESGEVDESVRIARQIARKDDLSEFDVDYAEYDKKRKKYFDDKAAEEKRLREEAERKAREEAERKAREEAERKAKEEAERKAREEAERKAKEEAERKAREEAERKAKEEAERKAKEEIARKAREEAERKAKEEAARKAKEKAARDLEEKYKKLDRVVKNSESISDLQNAIKELGRLNGYKSSKALIVQAYNKIKILTAQALRNQQKQRIWNIIVFVIVSLIEAAIFVLANKYSQLFALLIIPIELIGQSVAHSITKALKTEADDSQFLPVTFMGLGVVIIPAIVFPPLFDLGTPFGWNELLPNGAGFNVFFMIVESAAFMFMRQALYMKFTGYGIKHDMAWSIFATISFSLLESIMLLLSHMSIWWVCFIVVVVDVLWKVLIYRIDGFLIDSSNGAIATEIVIFVVSTIVVAFAAPAIGSTGILFDLSDAQGIRIFWNILLTLAELIGLGLIKGFLSMMLLTFD